MLKVHNLLSEHVLSTERSVVGGADLDINTSNDMDYNEVLYDVVICIGYRTMSSAIWRIFS